MASAEVWRDLHNDGMDLRHMYDPSVSSGAASLPCAKRRKEERKEDAGLLAGATRMIYGAPAPFLDEFSHESLHLQSPLRTVLCHSPRSFIWPHAARVNLVSQIAESAEPHWKLNFGERHFQFGREKKVLSDPHV